MCPALRQLTILLGRIKGSTQNSGGMKQLALRTPIKTFYRASLAPDSVLIESYTLTQLIFTTTL